jgi:DNA-binding transcriptional MerR regulator/methylmalonyl-CoA mutase cobalamin-binding subunit
LLSVYILFINFSPMVEMQHSIKIASRRSGLSAHVIRVWEKRYGAVVPSRTKTNRRLYDEATIERLRLLGLVTKAGHTIKNAAKLTTAELRTLLESESDQAPQLVTAPSSNGHVGEEAADYLDQSLVAIRLLDAAGFEAILNRGAVALGKPALILQTLAPLIEEIGCSWRNGTMRAVHEHLATAVMRTFLGNFSHGYALGENAPRIVITTPSGQLHELGAMLVAATADNHGWCVSYLGPSLPSEEIAGAVLVGGARAVALSIVYPKDDGSLNSELRKLRLLLPREVAILTGGRAAPAYASVLDEIQAIQVPNLSTLGEILDGLVSEQNQKDQSKTPRI